MDVRRLSGSAMIKLWERRKADKFHRLAHYLAADAATIRSRGHEDVADRVYDMARASRRVAEILRGEQ